MENPSPFADRCRRRRGRAPDFVRSTVRRSGVPVVETHGLFERLVAACLAGESTFLVVTIRRRTGQGISHRHPDEIAGPRRVESAAAKSEIDSKAATILGTVAANDTRVGRSLMDRRRASVADHERAASRSAERCSPTRRG